MQYESTVKYESESCPGVSFTVRRMSFARRMELIRRLHGAEARAEFHRAGAQESDSAEAFLLEEEVNRHYVEWGLDCISGLNIDGMEATAESLLSRGPERLCREVIERIKEQCFLTEEDQKN